MIIRPLLLRHGRLALPKPPSPVGTLRRHLSRTASISAQTQQGESITQQDNSITGSLASPTASAPPSEIRDPSSKVAQDWSFFHHQKSRTGNVGSSIAPHYKPHSLVINPPRPQDITLELLLASQAHIGHATSLWHPGNARYIFGVRGDHDPIHVISLDVTAAHLRRACKVLRGLTSRGGLVLFVGTRPGHARIIVRAAELAQGCHLFTKWVPGSITNGQQILGSCPKLVVDENDQPVLGFGDQLPRLSVLKPDLVVCLNPTENYILLHECGLHNIPTIGIIDTDANPTWVTYPIPANDDSLRAVQVICGTLGRAGEEGQGVRRGKARQGVVVSMPSHGLEPPREGQVEKEAEEQRREMVRKMEEDAKWKVIAEEVPGGAPVAALEAPKRKELEIEDGQLEELDATAGGVPAAGGGRSEGGAEEMEVSNSFIVDGEEIGSVEEMEGAMRSLGPKNAEEDYAYDDVFQPYERDRPLSEDELAQGPPLDREEGEIDGDEELGGGVRDR